MEDDDKSNNLTKRALFKERLSDINIENSVVFELQCIPELLFCIKYIFKIGLRL